MRFFLAAFAALFVERRTTSTTSCHGFSVGWSSSRHRMGSCFSLDVTSSSSAAEESTVSEKDTGRTLKRPLSPKEILERQREKMGLAGGVDDDDAYPKLFEDDLLDNMQQILLTLERRVREGPGSLTLLEVEEFECMSQNVLVEMKEKEYDRLRDAGGSSTTTVTTTNPSTLTTNPPPIVSSATIEAVPVLPDVNSQVDDLEDGPGYSAAGGNGSLAKGTVNTYIIPNMDSMSPEEYQTALQQSIIDRQKKRIASGQHYGNRATWDYLNNLSGNSGVMKATQSEEGFSD